MRENVYIYIYIYTREKGEKANLVLLLLRDQLLFPSALEVVIIAPVVFKLLVLEENDVFVWCGMRWVVSGWSIPRMKGNTKHWMYKHKNK